MIASAIVGAIVTAVVGFIQAFWLWLVGASVAVLAFLFSPTLRKYTLGVIAIAVILTATWIWGYNSKPDIVQVTTHQCDAFRKHLVTGEATDKALRILKNAKLCQ